MNHYYDIFFLLFKLDEVSKDLEKICRSNIQWQIKAKKIFSHSKRIELIQFSPLKAKRILRDKYLHMNLHLADDIRQMTNKQDWGTHPIIEEGAYSEFINPEDYIELTIRGLKNEFIFSSKSW